MTQQWDDSPVPKQAESIVSHFPGAEVRTWRSDSHMADNKSPNAILVLTYALLLVTAAWVAARFVAWQHEGSAGFYYAPAMPQGF